MTSRGTQRYGSSQIHGWSAGERVGRYELLGHLANGGMAEIWLARQEGVAGFEKLVVVKRINDSFTADASFVAMFLDEARVSAQLEHPNIVTVFDLGEHHGGYYLAMEYLHGEPLSAVFRACTSRGITFPIAHTVRLLAQAADALDHAHRRKGTNGEPLKIVHRDVSPQNLFVTFDGVLKVVDFGIAKAAGRATRTSAGQVKGKASYMSPEQVRGDDLDGRSDVFALGIVLYEAITGSRLFKRQGDLQTMEAICSPEPVPPAHQRNAAVPESLSRIAARALERDRENRYTAAELADALEQWSRDHDARSSKAELVRLLEDLFKAQIQRRERMLEEARAGRFASTTLHPDMPTVSLGPAAASADSMPGDARPSEPTVAEVPARRGRTVGVFVAAGVAAVLASVGVWVSRPPRPSPVPLPARPPVAEATSSASTPPITVAATPGAPAAAPPKDVAHAPPALPVGAVADDLPSAVVPASAKRTPAAPMRTAVTSAVAPKAPARGKGLLSLNTTPWTQVSLGSQSLGDTPLINVPLRAGVHKLKLVNPEHGLSTTIEISIEPNKTTAKNLRLAR